jgi:hypothetical protein
MRRSIVDRGGHVPADRARPALAPAFESTATAASLPGEVAQAKRPALRVGWPAKEDFAYPFGVMVAARRLSHVSLHLQEMRTEACAEQFDLKPA